MYSLWSEKITISIHLYIYICIYTPLCVTFLHIYIYTCVISFYMSYVGLYVYIRFGCSKIVLLTNAARRCSQRSGALHLWFVFIDVSYCRQLRDIYLSSLLELYWGMAHRMVEIYCTNPKKGGKCWILKDPCGIKIVVCFSQPIRTGGWTSRSSRLYIYLTHLEMLFKMSVLNGPYLLAEPSGLSEDCRSIQVISVPIL